jgi:hypothetical protein
MLGKPWGFLLFTSIVWEYFPKVRPLTGLLLILHMIYDYGDQRRNDTDRRKPKNSEINLSQCHLVHHNSHMLVPWIFSLNLLFYYPDRLSLSLSRFSFKGLMCYSLQWTPRCLSRVTSPWKPSARLNTQSRGMRRQLWSRLACTSSSRTCSTET